MMLGVDPNDPVWHRVKEALQRRQDEVMDELRSLVVDDRQRRDAAVRLDEISMLLNAPADTLAASQARAEGQAARRSIY
jgi:CHASE3 domain sensor protein